MSGKPITVWLPDPSAETIMGGLPGGFRADVWTGGSDLPPSADQVAVVIPPFAVLSPKLSLLAELPRLRLVQLLSAGAEQVIPHVPPGVTLATARGAHDDSVAEWVLGVILAHARSLPRFVRAQDEGRWDFTQTGTLVGKTVLILGYGSIGEAVARMVAPFGVTLLPVARHARDGVAGLSELPSLLPKADVVVLLVPVTPATTGMVDAKFLAQLADGALLVNAARGAIVDTEALLAELRAGRVHAALDVTDPEPLPSGHPLWSAPGLILTPHVAGASGHPMARALAVAKAQLVRYAAGEPLRNVVGEEGY
ncbi:MAG TPA: 2-hydroxyacid dehydrogenase [Streptosporangiaceae bacterium]